MYIHIYIKVNPHRSQAWKTVTEIAHSPRQLSRWAPPRIYMYIYIYICEEIYIYVSIYIYIYRYTSSHRS